MSYGLVTGYYSGYLSYFDIDIRYIDFWPSLHDFMTQAFPSILAIIVSSALLAVALLLMNCIHKFFKFLSNKYKRLRWLNFFSFAGAMSYGYMFAVVLLGLGVLSFNTVFSIAVNRDVSDAEKQNVFLVVTEEGGDRNVLTVVVYQNNNMAITKDYNTKSGAFTDSYKVSDLSGRKYVLKTF